jgi:CRISPR/Cas system endoribonuclease Cas6 (RAMP superfamily)
LRLFSRKRAILPSEFTPDLFLRALMRRVSMLIRLHGTQGPMPAFHPWVQRAATLHLVEPQLEWQPETRYSRRQNDTMSISGIVGEFTIAGEAATHFWPLLKLGEITHVGKGTIHGLGQFGVE